MAKLKKSEMHVYRDRLRLLRARLRGDVSQLADEALHTNGSEENSPGSRMPIHMADIGSDNFEQEFTLNLMASEEHTLEAIDAALARIEKGIYGLCEGCEGAIPKSRLNAIPYTSMCIKCAEAREQN